MDCTLSWTASFTLLSQSRIRSFEPRSRRRTDERSPTTGDRKRSMLAMSCVLHLPIIARADFFDRTLEFF